MTCWRRFRRFRRLQALGVWAAVHRTLLNRLGLLGAIPWERASLDSTSVRDRYPGIGRPSLDPIVFFKLQLHQFFEGLRSERRLLEVASLHLAHRWNLGYALDEPPPDHSALTKVRQRLDVEVFRRFFEHVVELCRAAGLVGGKELFFDATRARANAAVDAVVPRLGRVVRDHIEALLPEGGDAGDGPPGASAGVATPLPVTVVLLPPWRGRRTPPPSSGCGPTT